MKSPFKERLAVITGASGGIGYALAKLLAKQGARLVLVARDVRQSEIVKQELTSFTDYIRVIGANLSSAEACDALIHQLERLPYPVEVLINNARAGVSGYTVERALLWGLQRHQGICH